MTTYWKRLKNHPGVPVATIFTIIGTGAGIGNESMGMLSGSAFGAGMCALISWPIVLWTARTQPLPPEDA